MKLIDKSHWEAQAAQNPYWEHRWRYISVALDFLASIPGIRANSAVLEIGAGGMPLCHDSDRLAHAEHGVANTIIHDARVIPWPLPKKRYKVAIALQVYEHLDPAQRQITDHLCERAEWLLLSIPYRWKGGDAMHRDRDLSDLQEWIGDLPLVRWQVVSEGGNPILIALVKLTPPKKETTP